MATGSLLLLWFRFLFNGKCCVIVAHEGESEESHDKTYYVFLPPELCLVHPLPGSLVRGAQRLPSIMRRVESMLLAIQLKNTISYPVQALKEQPISKIEMMENTNGFEDEMEDGELESDSSSYRVLSSKTLADVVEALIGVYYVEGGKNAANHLMKWIGIQIEFDPDEMECTRKPFNVPESILRSVDFDALEGLSASLHPMVTPETLPMHPVRELQERCQQQAEGLRKCPCCFEREGSGKDSEKNDENGKKNGSQTFTRQTLNDICLRRNWPMPFYRCVNEGGPAHAKRFTFAVRVNTTDRGWTDECVGEPMPSVKKAKDSAAVLLLELLNKLYS
ncbi:Ribonuclease III domain [Sesbania bispinosa]|nr:Ribonuclease III domain [Sesbania bispinosa]